MKEGAVNRRIAAFAAVALLLATAACATPEAAREPATEPPVADPPRAVYFAPTEGGYLTADDLASHPQVVVVRDNIALKSALASGTAVWVDADALQQASMDWLIEWADEGRPIVLVGHGTSDRVLLHKLIIGNHARLPDGEPTLGFCVLKEKVPGLTTGPVQPGRDAYVGGFDVTPTVDAILDVTDRL